jgi:hypothetical protein
MDRTKLWKRGVGVAVAGGFALAASGCFVPNTGHLTVVISEEFFPTGPPAFTFDEDTYHVPQGDIDVDYIGPAGSDIPHDLRLQGEDESFVVLPSDVDSAEGEVELEPGTYEIYCSLTGHAGLGMTATLVVH